MALDRSLVSVSYAVRPAVVAKYFGALCVPLALAGLAPLLFALLIQDWRYAAYHAMVCVLLGVAGLLLNRLHPDVEVQRNEALVVVVLIFVVTSAAFALPMQAGGLSFSSALFESVSGITTTGLSLIGNTETLSPAVLFTAAWLQWTGGLGIMVLGYAMLFGQGVNAMRLSGVLSEQNDLIGGTRARGRIVLVVYLCLTAAGILLLYATGVGWFDAWALGLAAVSTGGFSPHSASIGGLQPAAQAVSVALGVCGTFSMLLYYRVWRGEWTALPGNPELRLFLLFTAVVAAGTAFSFWHSSGLSAGSALWNGTLTALSAQSTTGFSVLPVASLDAGARLLLVLAMLSGGGVGSTAGGVKLLRILLLLSLVRRLILRSRLSEHTVAPNRILGRNWSDEALLVAMLVILLHLLVTGISWLAFLFAGYDPLNALFEVTSAIGTVGLSTGITTTALPEPLQLVLVADMLLGRLEIVAILVFLAPRTWFGLRRGTEPQRDTG